ncbi:MAG: zinc-binding alcohol dehydrogenase [Chloroflexota bacterium]
MMQNRAITFVARNQVALVTEELDEAPLAQGEVLIETLYSAVSPGTELACLSGSEGWFSLPGVPGYSNVGQIIAMGEGVEDLNEGDYVLNFGKHQKYNRRTAKDFLLKVPPEIELQYAPITRLATVAFTAIRTSNIELGDDVAVVGLGPVGNFASQLARLQGGRVIGLDISPKRLEFASTCAIDLAINPTHEDAEALVNEITHNRGVDALIDASGNSAAIVSNLPLIGQTGELILLGSPRGEYTSDVTDLLNYVHLKPRGCITFKGAHEWRYPVQHDPFVKHSIERNAHIVWQLHQESKLNLSQIITHVAKPEEAPFIYEGLRTQKDSYMGIIFDWTN